MSQRSKQTFDTEAAAIQFIGSGVPMPATVSIAPDSEEDGKFRIYTDQDEQAVTQDQQETREGNLAFWEVEPTAPNPYA